MSDNGHLVDRLLRPLFDLSQPNSGWPQAAITVHVTDPEAQMRRAYPRQAFIEPQSTDCAAWMVTFATASGRPGAVHTNTTNTGSEIWADSAYRSQSNEAWLADRMLTSRIHRRKPKGKPMPAATARANAAKTSIHVNVEHVFAHQKNRFGLFIRTIGIVRAEAKLTLANLAYNFDRLAFHEKRAATP